MCRGEAGCPVPSCLVQLGTAPARRGTARGLEVGRDRAAAGRWGCSQRLWASPCRAVRCQWWSSAPGCVWGVGLGAQEGPRVMPPPSAPGTESFGLFSCMVNGEEREQTHRAVFR